MIKSTVDFETMFEKDIKNELKSKRTTVLKEIRRNMTPRKGEVEVEKGDVSGLAFLAKQQPHDDKCVQTDTFEVYVSDGEEEGTPRGVPAAKDAAGDTLGVENLVTKQAEALLAAKQILTRDNECLARDNQVLLDQVEYLNTMIDACERQRLELLEQNSALKFENILLSGTLSKARDRSEQPSPSTPPTPAALVDWFGDGVDYEGNREVFSEYLLTFLEKPFSLGERLGEALRDLGRLPEDENEYTLTGVYYNSFCDFYKQMGL